ncbi:hypothetical protein LUZ61_000058 [Rhynchospora tenuis]|uniref:Uncharacterized protein n=1 Tax=Rhynchospora tenuis TaxID=198213 RepID=A0AAD5ZEN8_9POAL|nr:hypothetical protein LUZ61_021017 [Rhynchospora tenuis]KAJ3696353.1 hypothetical protein LUZ61_000058 [Rhynchospora tenuis]
MACRWSLIAAHLPGRTDNEIKNYWNTHLSKIQHIQKTVVEETSEAMPIANVPDGLADDNDKFCCNSTKHQLIDTKEDEMKCQTAGNKEGRSTVLVQEPDSPQASGVVAPNSDKAGWELLSLSPLSPIYIGLEVDTMFREDGGAHDTEMKEVVVDRARNELAEMEAQLWDETETEKMGSGLGHIDIAAEGALNLETLANWLLSDY